MEINIETNIGINENEVWRHKKTQRLYQIMAIGKEESDLTDVVIYKSLKDGQVWVRNKEEFLDGRFVKENQGFII